MPAYIGPLPHWRRLHDGESSFEPSFCSSEPVEYVVVI
jgi:hypothetical protein